MTFDGSPGPPEHTLQLFTVRVVHGKAIPTLELPWRPTVHRTGLSDMYTGKCIAPLSDGAERLAVWSFRIDQWPVRRGSIATKAFLAFLRLSLATIRAAERISR